MPRPEHFDLCQWATRAVVQHLEFENKEAMIWALDQYTDNDGRGRGFTVTAEPFRSETGQVVEGRVRIYVVFPDSNILPLDMRYPRETDDWWSDFQRRHAGCVERSPTMRNLPVAFERAPGGWNFHVACPPCGSTTGTNVYFSRTTDSTVIGAASRPVEGPASRLIHRVRIRDIRTGKVYEIGGDIVFYNVTETGGDLRTSVYDLIKNFEVESEVRDEKRPSRYELMLQDP
jgi:hypothetical protein